MIGAGSMWRKPVSWPPRAGSSHGAARPQGDQCRLQLAHALPGMEKIAARCRFQCNAER